MVFIWERNRKLKHTTNVDVRTQTAALFIDSIILILLLNWMVYVVGVCQRQNINTPASAEHH